MSQNYIPMQYRDLQLEYDLSKYNPDETVYLFYDPEINRFIDSSFGHVIHDIYRFVTPSQVMLFKRAEEDRVYPDVTNSFLVELIYPPDIPF